MRKPPTDPVSPLLERGTEFTPIQLNVRPRNISGHDDIIGLHPKPGHARKVDGIAQLVAMTHAEKEWRALNEKFSESFPGDSTFLKPVGSFIQRN
jgi:hypothetical protein